MRLFGMVLIVLYVVVASECYAKEEWYKIIATGACDPWLNFEDDLKKMKQANLTHYIENRAVENGKPVSISLYVKFSEGDIREMVLYKGLKRCNKAKNDAQAKKIKKENNNILSTGSIDNDLDKYYPMTEGKSSTYCMFDDCSLKEIDTVVSCNSSGSGHKGCTKLSILSLSTDTAGIKTRAMYEIIGKRLMITAGTNPLTGEYRTFDEPSLVIQSPLVKGASWEENDDEFKTIVKVVNILPTYKVTAGEYTDVVKIEKKQYDNNKKTRKTAKPINVFYDYYAADVGLIKQELLEDKKISRVRELIEFTHK